MDRRLLIIAAVVLFLVAAIAYSCGKKSGPAEGFAPPVQQLVSQAP